MTITDKQVEAACAKYHGAAWHEYADYARRIDRERMRALLVEFAESATDAPGIVRVPLEPTEAMIDAAQSNATGGLMTREARAAVFRAMASAAPSSAEQPATGAFINPQHIAADIVRSCAHSGIEVDALDVLAAVERALPEPPAPGAPEADERGIVGLTRDLASCERALERRTIERNAFAAELDACSQYLKPGERVVDRIARELRDSASLLEMLATERAALEAARAQSSDAPSVAPVSARDGDTFFSYGDDHGGFETHGSAAEARAAAEECLGYFRDDAPEGWNDGVRNVCWGVILGEVVETESRPSTPDDPCHPDCSEFVEYELRDCVTPPADARDGEDDRNQRMRLFLIGRAVEQEELDDAHAKRLGLELQRMSRICPACRGTGRDGDPPDTNGEGGWIGDCANCGGSGEST